MTAPHRLALFDLDNTLVSRDDAFALWVGEFVTAHRLPPTSVQALLAADRRHAGPMGPFFEEIRETFGLTASADSLWHQYRSRMPELVRCGDDTRTALSDLRAREWRIGIVTNGMTDNQLGKIHRSGLADLVDGWCISGEAGVRKPDPAIFHLAARRCGAPLVGGWMVGDDRWKDIAGGSAAGLRTVWIVDGRPDRLPGPQPDATAGSVAEAVAVILAHG